MILGGGMLLILVIFLILVLFLIFNPPEDPFALTEAAIFTENANIETQIAETSTQSIINQTGTAEADMTGTSDAIEEGTSSAQTQIAVDFQVTSAALTQVVLGETATADAQETANAEMTANQIALTGQADTNATQTEISFQQTLNPDVTIPVLATTAVPPEATMPAEEPTLDLPAVAQTATALANLFSTPPTTAPVAGTPIAQNTEQASSTTGTTTGSTTGSTALPDTGLADDLFQLFAGDPRLALLAAFGLLGIIMISRGVRSANRKRKDD
jgi:hypothetical protein